MLVVVASVRRLSVPCALTPVC